MKYSGPVVSPTYPIGTGVYTVENDVPVLSTVTETESNIAINGSTVSFRYRLSKFGDKWFSSAEVFADAASIKSDFDTKADGASL